LERFLKFDSFNPKIRKKENVLKLKKNGLDQTVRDEWKMSFCNKISRKRALDQSKFFKFNSCKDGKIAQDGPKNKFSFSEQIFLQKSHLINLF
jgi:hypothetical protein